MKVSVNPKEGRSLVSVAEAIGLMFGFGMFIISFLNLILTISHKHNKKDRQ